VGEEGREGEEGRRGKERRGESREFQESDMEGVFVSNVEDKAREIGTLVQGSSRRRH